MAAKSLTPKDRFSWALSVIRPAKNDYILEIGCGAGLLVERMAPLLPNGQIIAVDRSEVMIKSARKRNKVFIDAGITELHATEYPHIPSENHSFDKIIAFNMSAFWEKPAQILPAIKNHLKPNGSFYLLNQPPFDKTKTLALKAETVLKENNFLVKEVIIEQLDPAPAFCIIAAQK